MTSCQSPRASAITRSWQGQLVRFERRRGALLEFASRSPGLAVMIMAYAIGHIFGGHLHPAISIGLGVGGRFCASELVLYIIAQVLGGAAGAGVLAPIAIGLGLTLIHLIGIPVTKLSVNPPAAPALFVGGWALAQLWLFWIAPIIGAVLAGVIYPLMAGKPSDSK